MHTSVLHFNIHTPFPHFNSQMHFSAHPHSQMHFSTPPNLRPPPLLLFRVSSCPPPSLGRAMRRRENRACLSSSRARAGRRALSAVTIPSRVVRRTPRGALPMSLVRLRTSPSILFEPSHVSPTPYRRVPWMRACWRFRADDQSPIFHTKRQIGGGGAGEFPAL